MPIILVRNNETTNTVVAGVNLTPPPSRQSYILRWDHNSLTIDGKEIMISRKMAHDLDRLVADFDNINNNRS